MSADAADDRSGGGVKLSSTFTPKLVSVLREGYGAAGLRADLVAGLTVAIVALPLSMALAIASGVSPDRGLYAAIVGGFLVSALGGSRFQIGGPAGAFIVLVSATVSRHGVDGLLLATTLAGLMLIAIGALRLGTYIRFIPYPVTIGFTAGIAVIIFASQLRDLFGLTLPGAEPGPFLDKIVALAKAAGTVNWAAAGTAALTVAIILGVRRWRPKWPALLIAVIVASLAAAFLALPVETIGSRFGGIPSGLPAPALPEITLAKVQAVLPDAIAFALLGAIESLLSAVVADSMTGRRHRSNMELVAQGIANIGSAVFGGITVTGTIARTATNIRSGAHGPASGMLHSAFLLGFMLVAAPLAAWIPLAALAGVLAVVAWTMFEKHAFAALLRASWGDAAVLLVTFLLVIFRDLTEGILVGFLLGSVLFIDRMTRTVAVEAKGGKEDPLEPDSETLVFRVSGPFFFGAATGVGTVLDRVGGAARNVIIDISGVPFLDSSGASAVEGAVAKARRAGVRVYVTGAGRQARRMLMTQGVAPPAVRFKRSEESARRQIAEAVGKRVQV